MEPWWVRSYDIRMNYGECSILRASIIPAVDKGIQEALISWCVVVYPVVRRLSYIDIRFLPERGLKDERLPYGCFYAPL